MTLNRQQYTPQTTTLTAVTDVTWNGTTLKYSSKQLQFVNGVLTQATTLADQTIDTPYQITWS